MDLGRGWFLIFYKQSILWLSCSFGQKLSKSNDFGKDWTTVSDHWKFIFG